MKKGEAKLLNDLKVWNHCEAKKKRYMVLLDTWSFYTGSRLHCNSPSQEQ